MVQLRILLKYEFRSLRHRRLLVMHLGDFLLSAQDSSCSCGLLLDWLNLILITEPIYLRVASKSVAAVLFIPELLDTLFFHNHVRLQVIWFSKLRFYGHCCYAVSPICNNSLSLLKASIDSRHILL